MELILLLILSMYTFSVVDHTGEEHTWTLEIVDEICNGVDCVAGLTHSYPIAKIQVVEKYLFSIDSQGCTVLHHEWLHMQHGDWYHEWVHEKYCK